MNAAQETEARGCICMHQVYLCICITQLSALNLPDSCLLLANSTKYYTLRLLQIIFHVDQHAVDSFTTDSRGPAKQSFCTDILRRSYWVLLSQDRF